MAFGTYPSTKRELQRTVRARRAATTTSGDTVRTILPREVETNDECYDSRKWRFERD
jgi:hypothetical protein